LPCSFSNKNWRIVAKTIYGGNGGIGQWNSNASENNCNVEILDDTGKTIVKIFNAQTPTTCAVITVNDSHPITTPWGGGGEVASSMAWISYTGRPRDFIINADVNANTMTVTFDIYTITLSGVYENGANIARPATFRIRITHSWSFFFYGINFSKLNFIES
jgi:hypothetical protein